MKAIFNLLTLLWIYHVPPNVVGDNENCPRVCDCFGTIVDCSNNGLNKIPRRLPLWAEEL